VPLAVIPWFELPTLSLGPVSIQSFGVLSALGILLATVLISRAAKELGKDPQVPVDYAVVGVLAGVVGGHLVHLLAYHPEELRDPWRIVMLWEGLSSMGGLLGGVVAAVIWFRAKRIPFRDYADAFALGIAPGWGVARIGCFTVHDHPGVLTSFPLAVQFPDGPRHDLGLYELLFTVVVLVPAVIVLNRRPRPPGTSVAVLSLLYAPARFLGDFLRNVDLPGADVRYVGLTIGQWGCIALAAVGVTAAMRLRRHPVAGR
jgi:phosphatidylglycerol:prolipoprotein diacylglycerol transferase